MPSAATSKSRIPCSAFPPTELVAGMSMKCGGSCLRDSLSWKGEQRWDWGVEQLVGRRDSLVRPVLQCLYRYSMQSVRGQAPRPETGAGPSSRSPRAGRRPRPGNGAAVTVIAAAPGDRGAGARSTRLCAMAALTGVVMMVTSAPWDARRQPRSAMGITWLMVPVHGRSTKSEAWRWRRSPFLARTGKDG